MPPIPMEAIVCLSREAMACLFEIQFPQGSMDRGAAVRAFDWIDEVERQLSVYRDDSDISRVNRESFHQPIELDSTLFAFLVDCQRLWAETGGAFDVTMGPLIRAWGFKARQGRVPAEDALSSARSLVGMGAVKFDARRRAVQLEKEGMEINLGGIGKGYALDRISEFLVNQHARSHSKPRSGGIIHPRASAASPRVRGQANPQPQRGDITRPSVSALLGAGRSSIRAIGNAPGEAGWLVDLADPIHPNQALATIRLTDGALSTSGTSEQFFEHEGRRLGHILDPRTGWPVEGMSQATALAPSAAWAEALSTAFFVLGAEWAADYCRRNPTIGAIIVPKPDEGRPDVATVVGNVDVAHWSPSAIRRRV